MKTEYYTFVDASNASGILRWIAAILLVIISIAFLIRQIKTKKSLAFITSFISTLVLVPLLIITPIHITINPGETPEPQPVDPIPHVDPEPEPVPEPDENPVEPVAPSNVTPSTKPSDDQTPSTPDEPDAPSEPEVTAKYTVIHRQQNLENDDYSIVESETQTGVVGNSVTPSTKAYTGFVAPAAKTTTVAEDGSTEIIYDYDREKIAFALGDIENTTSSLPTGEYKYGTKVTLTANDRIGYVFDRWNNDATTNPITIELTETTTIKPIYEANNYQIIFDKNSSVAAGSMSAQTMTYDQAKPLSKNSFVLEGYTFNHWNTESNDSGNSYTDEESVINLRTEGEITLYAFWTANTNTAYTVKHYKQNIGGGDHYTLAETDNETGTTDTIATPDRKTYTGFTAPAAQSKKITGDGEMLIEYYYVRNQYTVTFGENAGSISSDDFISGQKYYFEQSGTLTADSKTGYTFVDWTDGVTDASRSFTIGAEDATIGANYRANTYAVIFHANYLNSSATASQSFTYDQAPTSLAENSFSRPGYDFDHWSVNPNDSGTGYGDKEEVQNLTSVDGGEYHLYAQWTARKYTIAFDKNADDATGSMNPQDMTYDQVADLSANQFQRASYNFKGWSTNPNATTKEYSDGEEVINLATGGTVTLYAVWEDKFPVVFSVEGDCIFNGKDGTITTSSTCLFGDTNFVGQTFVDTGISLNTSENFNKDYEISFNIDSYSPNQVEAQATFVSNKISTTHPTSQLPNPPSPLPQAKSPGVVVRKSGNNIDIRSALLNETGSGYLEANYIKPYTEFQTIKIVRHNRIVYISINGGNLFELQDVSDFNQYFNQTTWFGAYPNDGTEDPEPKNVLVGTLSNLSIRLGEMDWNYYQVEFDAKSGTLDNSYKKMQIEKGTSIETLPVTTRKKYIFDGWFIGNTQISDGYTPTEDVKIIAKWARNVQQAIASPSSFELTRGDEAYLTITNKNNIEPFTMSSSNDQIATIDQDGKVTAVSNGQAKIVLTGSRSGEIFEIPVTVTLPRYTVHFDTKGGNEIADITDVEEGSSIGTLPADPTRTGYVFDGWFLENSNTAFAADTPVMDDITVEAHWLKDITQIVIANPDIEIEVNGQTATIQLSNVNDMEAFMFASGDETIATVDQNGVISPVSAGQTIITITGQRSGKTATVAVVVLAEKVQLTFDDQMGNTSADKLRIGETLGSLADDISYEHYIFRGWYTDATAGDKVTSATVVTGEMTYYAHWTKTVYHLVVDPTVINVDKGYTSNFTFDDLTDIESFTYAIEDSTYANVEGTVITGIAKGETRLIITGDESTETKAVTVKVNPHMLAATFNYLDGSQEITEEVEEGESFADLPTKPRENYYLDGWYTQANGQGTKLTTDDAILGQNSNYYYAYWLASISTATISPTQLTIGIGESGTIQVTNEYEPLEPFSFSVDDNTIAEISNQGVVTAKAAGQTTITITGDRTGETRTVDLTATEPVTATFSDYDGTIIEERIVNRGAELGELPTPPSRGDDYNFHGWFTEDDGGNEIRSDTSIQADTTFYAQWKYVPVVWSNLGACTFSPEVDSSLGKTVGHVSGTECAYADQEYIDTGVSLYSTANVSKDYEIYFEINSYNSNAQVGYNSDDQKQQTFVNAKDPVGNANGLIIRRSGSKIEVNSKSAKVQPTAPSEQGSKVTSIKVARRKGVIYYSFNGETEQSLQNVSNSETFPLATWFGAYPVKGTYTTPQTTYDAKRFITATLSNMYIRLETEEPRKPENVITFKTSSDAIEDYYASVDTWNANGDEDEFLAAMKGNFDSHQCKYSAKDDLSEDFPADYKYGNGSNYCDRPDTYDTGVNGAVSVYRVINETTGEKENTPVAYADGSNGKITNLIPGEMYYWESNADSEVYGFIKAEGTRRIISLPSARNARDLGGLTGQNGKKLKYGILLRGEQLGTGDVSVLQDKLGIDYEYELRGGSSNQSGSHFEGDARKNKQVYNYNFNYGISPHYETTKASLISLMQDIIAGNSIYLHCSHGADRAGTLAYLAEALLGVDYETRTRDYELTTFSGRPDKTRYYDHKGTPPFNVADNVEFHPGRKYKWMTTFAKTNEQVIEWFKADLTTDEEKQEADNLIEQFRAAALEGYND